MIAVLRSISLCPSMPPEAMRKKSVLIVEDDPIIMLSLEFLVQKNGYQTHLAASGEAALESARTHQPDLILLDVMLPHCSGDEICQILRTKEAFQHTKIILLSAKGREVDIEHGLAVGADAYVTKPFSTHALVSQIQELLAEP